jgi:hypothetical protein
MTNNMARTGTLSTAPGNALNIALTIRLPAAPMNAMLRPIDRVPAVLHEDLAKLIRLEMPSPVKYFVMEVTDGESTRLILRFGSFRSPHPKICTDAIAEVKRINDILEVAETPEPGTLSKVGQTIFINDYSGTGHMERFLNAAMDGKAEIALR